MHVTNPMIISMHKILLANCDLFEPYWSLAAIKGFQFEEIFQKLFRNKYTVITSLL